MTKEEAVRYLIKPICTSTIESEEYRKQLEAYTMAIESLNGRGESKMNTKYDIDDIIYIPFKVTSIDAHKNREGTPVIQYKMTALAEFSYVGSIYLNEKLIEALGRKQNEIH